MERERRDMKKGYQWKKLIAMLMALALVIGCLTGLGVIEAGAFGGNSLTANGDSNDDASSDSQGNYDFFNAITIDANLDDWQVFGDAAGRGGALEFVKTVRSGNRLYVAVKTEGTPANAPSWYIGFNTDGDAATGYADYSGVEYSILGDGNLYRNLDATSWSWEPASAGTLEMAASADGSVVELVVDLGVIGQSSSMSVFVLGVVTDWDYVAREVPVLSYHKAINASLTWDVAGENAHKFTNAGSDGAYLSDITQETTAEGLKAVFTMANYKKSRFWTEFDNAVELSGVERLLVSYTASEDITFKGLTARVQDASKSELYKIPVTKLANGLFSVDFPEGAAGAAKYIRWYWEGMDADMSANTTVLFKDVSFKGIAGSQTGGDDTGFAISIDGDNSDWKDIRDILDTPDGAFDRVASFIDENYFYVMFAVNDVTNWCTLQMFIDADGNPNTGFSTSFGGFEYLVEGASLYKSEAGEWPNTQVGAATVGKALDGSVYEVRLPLKTLGENITKINFHIGLVNSSWATAYDFPTAGTVSAMSFEDAQIISDEPYISEFSIHVGDVKALTAETKKGGTIATFSANGGDGVNYTYSFVFSEKFGKDNAKFTISGDRLIVAEKMLAPGEYKIYVKVKSGVRYDMKAFSVVVGASGEVSITEDSFNGNEGEWFAVPYSTANPVPNLSELRAAADSNNLYVYALAQVLSTNTKLYISDGVTAGADLSAKWRGADSVAFMVDYFGKVYKYTNGAWEATGDTIQFASAVTGFETIIPASVFAAGATEFAVAIDDGSGSMLPNAGERMMTVTKPLEGQAPVITQDGDPSEWPAEYRIGIGTGSMGDLWAVRTADYLYVMTYVLVDDKEIDTEYSYSTNLYIDSDNNTSTGYGYKEIYTEAGADFLLQDWYITNPELTFRTGNGAGFGFSHSKGGCGDYLTDWKVTKPTDNKNEFCMEFKVPIADLERISGMVIDDMSVSVQRDSTVRTSYPGVTKADRADGVYYSLVPKFGTSFNITADGSFSEWASIPNVVYNTATENVYNVYATTSQYKLYAMLSSENEDLNTQTQFIINTSDMTGFTYKQVANADYVVKDGNLYPVIANEMLGDKIKAVDIDYTNSAISLRMYLEDLENPEMIKITARALNGAITVPAKGSMNVSARFEMDYEDGYVYPYENFETYNNPYKGWVTWANGKLDEFDDIAYDFNLAYFPVTWADIEEEKGVFDWSGVDSKYNLSYMKENGIRVNFRFVLDTPERLTGSLKNTTYGYSVDRAFMEKYDLIDASTGKVTEAKMKALVATGNFRMDIPEWLAAELCNEALENGGNAGTFYNWPDPDVLGGASFSPNYYSTALQNYHDSIIEAFAAKFDDASITGFVQVGSLGHWGEFHTWPEASSFSQYDFGSGEFPDPTTAGRYAESYVKYFKNIKIGLRYPYPFAAKNGFGLFNDVFGAEEGTESFLGAIKNGNSVNITNPSGTDIADSKMPDFWKTNYSGGEFSNGDVIRWVDNDSIMQTITYLKDSHTSWLGPCSPCDLHDGSFNTYTYEGNIKYLQRLMGYRFSVKRVSYTSSIIPGETLNLEIDWRNSGVAPFYYDWPVEVLLLDAEGRVAASTIIENTNITEWLPETDIHTEVALDIPANIAIGKYTVAVAILDPATGKPAIHLANECGNDDLTYGLYNIIVGAKAFRAASVDAELGRITGDANGILVTLNNVKSASKVTIKQRLLPAGSTAYLYRADFENGTLTAVQDNEYTVAENGIVKLTIRESGSYVLLDRKAD